jgi:hypothetical protein
VKKKKKKKIEKKRCLFVKRTGERKGRWESDGEERMR